MGKVYMLHSKHWGHWIICIRKVWSCTKYSCQEQFRIGNQFQLKLTEGKMWQWYILLLPVTLFSPSFFHPDAHRAVSPTFFPYYLLPFLNFVFTGKPSSWLRDSPMPCDRSVESVRNWLCLAWDSPWSLLTETTQQPCGQDLGMDTKYSLTHCQHRHKGRLTHTKTLMSCYWCLRRPDIV